MDRSAGRGRARRTRAAGERSYGYARAWLTLLIVLAFGCTPRSRSGTAKLDEASPSARRRPDEPAAPPHSAARSTPAASPEVLHDSPAYSWQSDRTLDVPVATHALSERFATPAGFARIALDAGSFARFLRTLPLTAPHTPVRSFAGRVLYEPNDERIAAVVALDVGRGDLQQCADAIIRLHAEWLWSKGRRDMNYSAASGVLLPFQRWARGERLVLDGQTVRWQPMRKAKPADHATFRKYLDSVFAFANSASLARQARAVEPQALRPGDFFVLPGNPGHAVLVVDLARSEDGREVALLAQSYMPAQNVHVLRSSTGAWFALDREASIHTPFWRPFPWTALRRLAE